MTKGLFCDIILRSNSSNYKTMDIEQKEQALEAAMRGTDETLETAEKAISETEKILSEQEQEKMADALIDEVVKEDATVEEAA